MKAISWLGWVLSGALVAAAWTGMRPPASVARAVIYFPSVHPEPFLQLTKALRQDPAEELDSVPVSTGNPEIPELALQILQSRSAAEAVLNTSGTSSNPSRWRGDPVDSLLEHLTVELQPPATLCIELEAATGEKARTQLQHLLDYYSAFLSKNSLTRVQRARRATELRLTATVKSLAKMEESMSRSSAGDLRQLGDATIKANPKVMKQLWLRRLEEEGRSQELLDKLQSIRKTKDTPNSQDAWMAEWSAGQKSRPKTGNLFRHVPVRRQDLLSRAKLERDYYAALIQHRSLVLQHSFLLTWETLENYQFETIDPVSVRSRRRPWGTNLGWGALLGLLLKMITSGAKPKNHAKSPK